MDNMQRQHEHIEPTDIELGEELTNVEVKRPGGMVVSVRLSGEEARQLQEIARRAGKPLAAVARESLQATIARGASEVVRQG